MPKTGLYDNLINKALDLEISKAEQKNLKVIIAPLDEGDSYLYFARYLSGVLAQVLSSLPEKDRVEKQLEIANDIIQVVPKKAPRTLHALDAQVIRKDLLLGILERDLERPDSPLSTHCLITGSRHEPSFVSQLVKEIASADKVDILCSFVKWSGVRVLQEQLEALASAGRLLRLTPEKDCLTVLDFVGHAHKSFRYDRQFRALMRPGCGPIYEEVARGFAHLPSGCVIHMEPVAKAYILENIRQAIHSTRLQLVQRIREFEGESELSLTLDNFTSYHHLELDQIYKHASWERLLVLADKRDDFSDPDEERLTKGMRRMASISAPKCIAAWMHLTEMGNDDGTIGQLTEEESRFLTMLHYIMWGKQWPERTLADSLTRLRKNEVIFEEMEKLLALRRDITDQLPIATDIPPNCTLELHAGYSRDEILCAFGLSTVSHAMPFREGVLYVPELDSDIFFVTLNKTERDYSPTTMYEDYAISEDLFHWQSQSTTSELSNTGQRYINHRSKGGSIFLFVREQKRRNGVTEPYIFLGPMEYVSHEGSRPMSITWRLKHPLPARLLPTIRQLAVS